MKKFVNSAESAFEWRFQQTHHTVGMFIQLQHEYFIWTVFSKLNFVATIVRWARFR